VETLQTRFSKVHLHYAKDEIKRIKVMDKTYLHGYFVVAARPSFDPHHMEMEPWRGNELVRGAADG